MLRSRTSGCKVSPAATRTHQTELHQQPEQANGRPSAQNNNNNSIWLDGARASGGADMKPADGDLGGPTSAHAHLMEQQNEATSLACPSGTGDNSARLDSELTGRPIIRFLGQIRSAFARRSRRKESDKTATIQQHLRAIRHAENLDRQTHFRRSQGESCCTRLLCSS